MKSLKILLLLAVALGLCQCANTDSANLPDYHNSPDSQYYTTFQVGDWFELRKPMFLIHDSNDELLITKPGQSSPQVEDFLSAGGKVPYSPYYIVKYLPEGTRIKVVAVKKPSNFGPVALFYLDPEHPRVDALFRKSWSLDSWYDRDQVERILGNRKFPENVRFVVDYQRDYYRKVK